MIKRLHPWMAVPAVATLLVLASLAAPFNHDEDQYYAASQALFAGLPYRDFIYLQTPLNLFVGNLVMALSPGNSLWLLRVGQALLGAAVIAPVLCENLKSSERRHAIICAVLMATCYSFLFAATVFRNDMLPTLLSAIGIGILVHEAARIDTSRAALPAPRRAFSLGGLLLALAASAKVNFLLLCAVPVLWIVLMRGIDMRRRVEWLAWLGLGGVIGGIPSALGLALGGERFMWQVVEFGSEAPLHWYTLTGKGDRLTLDDRIIEALEILIQGPALLALLLVGAHRAVQIRRGNWEGGRELLLDLFILAGLAAAFLPNPSWRQYYVVPLPALFMRLPAVLASFTLVGRKLATGALMLFAFVGAGAWVGEVTEMIEQPERSIFVRWQESQWIGTVLRQSKAEGAVASLSPHLIVDSGRPVDPRFTSGVFVYRWGVNRPDGEILQMGGAGPDSLQTLLRTCPPAAIVTGYEGGKSGTFAMDLEAPLRAFAEQAGYELHKSPYGKARLYVRPTDASHCRPVHAPMLVTSLVQL